MTEAAILEHLRLQEGRLFQNERTLALYLDVKVVIVEALVKNLQDGLMFVPTDDQVLRVETALKRLAPLGVRQYHELSLNECIQSVAKLLWPSQMLSVARPKVSTLLHGMIKRLSSDPNLHNFVAYDPFKQDFVVREAFRRTLVNDCLVVYEDADVDTKVENTAAPVNLDEDVGPNDSASQFGAGVNHIDHASQEHLHVSHNELQVDRPANSVIEAPKEPRPVGARSALGPVHDGDGRSVAKSVARSMVRSVISNADQLRDSSTAKETSKDAAKDTESVAPSVAPRVIEVTDQQSATSRHSARTHASSVLRRPTNVRRIHIDTIEE